MQILRGYVYLNFLNIKLPIDEWRCTAVQASMLGLPNNLKRCS